MLALEPDQPISLAQQMVQVFSRFQQTTPLNTNWDLGLRLNRTATENDLESDNVLVAISRKF